VREKILAESKPRKRDVREFTFVRMMMCGKCGGGVTGFEKQKVIKSTGETKWYTYYGCTGGKDRNCKNPYIREESVIAQLGEIVEQLDIDELGAKHLIEREIARYNKLRKTVLGSKEKDDAAVMDVKRYAKYLLEEGSMDEKRELLSHLRGRLVVTDKKIAIAREPSKIPA
jgi:ribosomal protein L15